MHHLLGVLLPVWLAAPPPGAATRLVALDNGLLAATERGLYRSAGRGWSLVLARGAVSDLVGLRGGWLAAAGGGLYEATRGAVRARALGAGARARSLAVDGDGSIWVATEAGLYARRTGDTDFTLDTKLPAGAVHAVRATGTQVWIARDGELWSRRGDGSWRARLRGLGPGWWELVGAVPLPSGTLLAVPRGLWRVEGEEARRIEHAGGELRAIVAANGAVWLASTRGVLRTPLERLGSGVPELVVEGEAFDAIPDVDTLLVMTRSGVARLPLSRARQPLARPSLLPPGYRAARVDPLDLQRAVISYQGLSPSHMRRLAERARRTAWWPEVRLSAAWDRDRARDEDRDETFTSGALRKLRDSARERDSSLGIDVQLSWDLPRLTDPDDLLAISRERRELVELRDQVLERVNRLYFERRRVLQEHAAAEPDAARALSLRAQELGAQLDGWTGGQFSRLEATSPPNPRSKP
jgi:hypothetical protein